MPSPRPTPILFVLLAACGDPRPPAPIVELRAGADTVATGYAEIVDGEWLVEGQSHNACFDGRDFHV